jgi:redox-regulated HSP33 family molecular chaperone
MDIKIDAGITPPPEQPKLGELLRKLEVHKNEKSKSSFAVKKDQFGRLRTAVANAHRDTTMRFMTRTQKERDPQSKRMEQVLRVWRIE